MVLIVVLVYCGVQRRGSPGENPLAIMAIKAIF